MSFEIDDVMEVLKIIRECKDAELHIETGDMKLSVTRGKVGSSGAGAGITARSTRRRSRSPVR